MFPSVVNEMFILGDPINSRIVRGIRNIVPKRNVKAVIWTGDREIKSFLPMTVYNENDIIAMMI